MIISANVINRPRRVRNCEHCGQPIAGATLRLYGAAQTGDKPYTIYLHPGCTEWKHPKIEKAVSP